MYKTRLAQWGFNKYTKDNDWQAMAILHKRRQKAGKRHTVFDVHGHKKTLRDLRKYLKSRHISDDDFLSDSAAADMRIPEYIRARTPELDHMSISSPARPLATSSTHGIPHTRAVGDGQASSDLSLLSSTARTRSESLLSGQYEVVAHSSSPSMASDSDKQGPTARQQSITVSAHEDLARVGFGAMATSAAPIDSEYDFCDEEQRKLGMLLLRSMTSESEQLPCTSRDTGSWTTLSPKTTTSGRNSFCSRCRTRMSNHLPFPMEFLWRKRSFLPPSLFSDNVQFAAMIPHDLDVAFVWMACCLGACMFVRQQSFDFVAKSLQRADEALEEMLRNENTSVLTTLNCILVLLHSHDQGNMAASVIRSALHVVETVLGTDNPMTTTLIWMTALAGGRLPSCQVTTGDLRRVQAGFQTRLGSLHEHTLATSYHLGFNLIRDKSYVEAESTLRALCDSSMAVLGPYHMQTTSAQNALSRVLSYQGNVEEAILISKQALESIRKTFGPEHPHYLESRRRLALLYEKQGQQVMMEPIYWEVLSGRIKSLGPDHAYTLGAKQDLITLLKYLDKWEGGEAQKAIDRLFDNAEELSDYEVT